MTTLATLAAPTVRVTPELMAEWAARHDQFRPGPGEAAEAYAVGRDDCGLDLAPLEEIQRVDEHTRSTIWVVREDLRVTGHYFFLQLTERGHAALLARSFTPRRIDLRWVAAPGEACFACYGWGFGGATKHARRAVVASSMALRSGLFAPVPAYSRGVTLAGRISMRRIGYEPLPGQPDLYVSAPALEAAA